MDSNPLSHPHPPIITAISASRPPCWFTGLISSSSHRVLSLRATAAHATALSRRRRRLRSLTMQLSSSVSPDWPPPFHHSNLHRGRRAVPASAQRLISHPHPRGGDDDDDGDDDHKDGKPLRSMFLSFAVESICAVIRGPSPLRSQRRRPIRTDPGLLASACVQPLKAVTDCLQDREMSPSRRSLARPALASARHERRHQYVYSTCRSQTGVCRAACRVRRPVTRPLALIDLTFSLSLALGACPGPSSIVADETMPG
jgi:hypothetical protein